MSEIKSSETLKEKAKAAAGLPAAVGEGIDISAFISEAEPQSYRADASQLPARAKEYIKDGKVSEGILNRVEVAILCYDPCLSCSTHALGQMPLGIIVYNADGGVHQVLRS
jgi:Ni,Fe-hydrogenase I large subunit